MKEKIKKFLAKFGLIEKIGETHINVLTVNHKVNWTEADAISLCEFFNTPLGQKFLGKIEAGVHDIHGWACSTADNKNYLHAMGTANGYKVFYANVLQLGTIQRISEGGADNQVTEPLLERLKT